VFQVFYKKGSTGLDPSAIPISRDTIGPYVATHADAAQKAIPHDGIVKRYWGDGPRIPSKIQSLFIWCAGQADHWLNIAIRQVHDLEHRLSKAIEKARTLAEEESKLIGLNEKQMQDLIDFQTAIGRVEQELKIVSGK